MFKRKSRSDEAPRYEEPSSGIKVYPPGERVEVDHTPAQPRQPSKGNGPLDSPPTPVTIISGRHRKQILR